jgi:hypothetical protein
MPIRGACFSPNSVVTLIWDINGTTKVGLGTGTTDLYGRFITEFTVPDVPSGKYNITAIDQNLNSGYINFTVVDTIIRLDNNEGPVGRNVGIMGRGFAPNSQVTITWNGTQIGTATTDAEGNFEATVTVPNSIMGIHLLKVEDQSNNSAEELYYVDPAVTTNVREGPTGTQVTAVGTGWNATTAFSLHLSRDYLGIKVANGVQTQTEASQ